jgi:hypothetical protein
MPTTIEIYRDHQLTLVEQASGLFSVDIERAGGIGRPFSTQAFATMAAAFEAARLALDRGISG